MKTAGEVFPVEGTAYAKVLWQEAAQKSPEPNRRPVWLETRQPPGCTGHLHFFLFVSNHWFVFFVNLSVD